jgi:hypothetical protein
MGQCRSWSGAGVVLLVACAEEPAPDPSDDAAGQSVLYACDRIGESSLAPDEVTPLGFAPSDVLSFVLGSRPLQMRWWSPYFREDGGVWEVTPGETNGVQIGVERIGESRWVDREPTPLGGDCPDVVEADVRVTVTSAEAAFAESFDGEALLWEDRVAVKASIDVADLGDRYTFNPPSAGGGAPRRLEVSAEFTRYGQVGWLLQRYAPDDTAGIGIASWPDWEDCGVRGWTPAFDPAQHPSPEELLALVRGTSGLTLTNARGESAPLALGVSASPRSACFNPWPDAAEDPEQVLDALSLLTEVTLDSPALPGPLKVPLEVVGTFAPTGASFEQARFVTRHQPCGTEWYHSPADFVDRCGDWGVELGGVDTVFLQVESGITPGGGAFASFSIRGVRAPGCTGSPDGFACSGSAPLAFTDVTLGEVRIARE